MDWDSIRQFILEDREIKEYFLLLAGGENPLQAECDRREPFYGIPSPGQPTKTHRHRVMYRKCLLRHPGQRM